MGFYPVEVLVNDAKRHGVAVLPVDVNRSAWRTTTEWVGRPGWAMAGVDGDDGSHDGDEGEPMPEGCGIDARPAPGAIARVRDPGRGLARPVGGGVDDRLGRPARAAPGQGDRRGAGGAARRGAGPRAVHVAGGRRRADRARRGGHGAADPRGGAGLAGPAAAGAAVAAARGGGGVEGARGRPGGARPGQGAGRGPADGPAPAGDRGAAAAGDHGAGAAGRRLRGRRARRAPPGGEPVPRGAGQAGGGDQRGPRRASAGPGPASAASSSPGSTR